MGEHTHIREELLLRRAELHKRLEKIKSNVRRIGAPLDPDFAEQAVQRENDEVLDALGVAASQELARIGGALARIESDEYGMCAECREPISVERLKVLPYSEFCIGCAEKLGPGR